MKEKILLVDDEEGIRKVFGIILRDMGYEVLIAENGREALDIFPVEQPPIVVMDIKMPGMDGIQVLRRLKHENPECEVIIITGHGDMELAIQSLQYEATDFITKPIDERLLARALRKAHERILIRRQLRSYTENLEDLVQRKTEKLAHAATLASAGDTETYRHLFEELPGYVTVVAPDFSIKAANRLFRKDFGYDPGGDGVVRCHELLKGSDEPCLDCLVEQTFEDGRSHQREMKLTARNGARLDLFAWTSPLPPSETDLDGVMLMAMDISQVVDLKDRLASLGLMIGSVSHGIKGLLTGLDGGLYMIDSGVSREDTGRINEGVATVRVMADRIRSMILDILYYAKERTLEKAPALVGDFMEAVAAVVAPKAGKLGIDFRREAEPALGERSVEIDADQLSTALVNILENAFEACQADAAKETHEVSFRAEAADGAVVFQIADDGIGMSEETRSHIFTLFYSSKGSHGTGIGLFVARKIVQQHGGTIEVESRPGVGSRFRIVIPFGGRA